MVWPFVIHEFGQLSTREVGAVTTCLDGSGFGACSERAASDVVVYEVTAATIAVFGTACAAVEPAWPKLSGLHSVLLFSLTVRVDPRPVSGLRVQAGVIRRGSDSSRTGERAYSNKI